jgi:photosystem II stability/assembly factor-like uncharacterized protein
MLFYIFCFCGIYFLSSCKNNPINDGGSTQVGEWQYLGLGNESITSIAIDPSNENIIYAGSSSDFSSGTSGKLFRSTDGGKSWDILISGSNARFNAIIIDPINTSTVYAANGSIIKSVNAGLTWTDITGGIHTDNDTRAYALAMDPKNSNVLYAGTGGFFGGGLYKSTDAGKDWFWTGDSLKDGVTSIEIDPNNSNTLFVGTANRTILWKSTDTGLHWKQTGLLGKGLVYSILFNSSVSIIIFAATISNGIWESMDNGSTWQTFNKGLPDSSGAVKITRNTDTKILYAIETKGDEGGIYKREPTGIWEKIGINNLSSSSFYYSDLKINNDNNYLYFGNKGIYRYKL